MDDVAQQLATQGIEPSLVLAVTQHVLASPTVALRRTAESTTDCLQALLMCPPEGGTEAIQVVVRAAVVHAKPPEIREVVAHVDLVDPVGNPEDLIGELVGWHLDYPNPDRSPRETTGPQVIGWLGTPRPPLYRDAPPDWESQVEGSGRVFGARVLVAGTPESAARMSLAVASDITFVLNTGPQTSEVAAAVGRAATHRATGPVTRSPVIVGQPGTSFTSALVQMRRGILDAFEVAQIGGPAERDLTPGEVIYHRKSGENRRFDRFDEGSTKPCNHGGVSGSFVPWKGDKALKGMRRRYRNFTPEMLRHCSKYPNCGMYMVDATCLIAEGHQPVLGG